MALLRLLSTLFFGPKVTVPRPTFAAAKAPDFEKVSDDVRQAVAMLYGGRCVRIYVVDGGSSTAEGLEIMALQNAYYDCERFGLRFVTSPRQADLLLVTGPVTRNLEQAVKMTYEAAPQPCLVAAVGDGACTGGLWTDSYAVVGPVDAVIPVHIRIPGDPPTPTVILRGILQTLHSARN